MINECRKKHTNRLLEPYFKGIKTPHSLIELSMVDWQRYRNQCIELLGVEYNKVQGFINYKQIVYGNKIKSKRTKISDNKSSFVTSEINFNSMKNRFFMIVVNKEECICHNPSLCTLYSTPNDDPSGQLIIFAGILNLDKVATKVWNETDTKLLKQCKPNIIQKNNHHHSTGYYCSFGNKGSFEKNIHTSVGQYKSKRCNSEEKQKIITEKSNLKEYECCEEIGRAVGRLSKMIRNIKHKISPVLNVGFNLQRDNVDVNFKKVLSSNYGCWQSSICVNAQTKEFHTEKDCTYTLITIPNQSNMKDNQKRYKFLFRFNEKKYCSIQLSIGMSFIFSGTYLTHRQYANVNDDMNISDFFNVASYGNKRLFCHLNKSLHLNK